jgi:glyoxylase-like metal-dependent hydrolase (beta-lactamase superfamily II)
MPIVRALAEAALRIHHLNAISLCPLGGPLVDGAGLRLRARLVCHCLLVEAPDGLVLVDTGLGRRDLEAPRARLGRVFNALFRPDLHTEMTAVRQVERLGYEPTDVRHVVLTHLDVDHAGGLDDFPQAAVHLLEEERGAALRERPLGRPSARTRRWSPERWHAYARGEGEPWFGFDAVRDLDGLPSDILLVPLIGRTRGHTGVAVRGPRGWLLHAGDAYFHRDEIDPDFATCPAALGLYERLTSEDDRARRWNRDRLRELRREHGAEVTVTCSHDPVEFEALAGRALDTPSPARYLGPVERTFGEARP